MLFRSNELRNLLFNFGGRFAAQDLKALNIQRGRDHGLADYNTIREAFGLERVTTFAEINPDVEAQSKLESLYGTVDNIDAIVGMFAENPMGDAAFGETIAAVLVDATLNLRDLKVGVPGNARSRGMKASSSSVCMPPRPGRGPMTCTSQSANGMAHPPSPSH